VQGFQLRLKPLLALACGVAGLIWSGVVANRVFPAQFEPVRYAIKRAMGTAAALDGEDRVIWYSGKQEVACPETSSRKIGVVLAIGQSNIANYGAPDRGQTTDSAVLNLFNGKCYLASSPMLGATGVYGSYLPVLGQELVKQGVYDVVVFVSIAVGSSNIARWAEGGDLNHHMLHIAGEIKEKGYEVTNVLVHQGEADFLENTSSRDYIDRFRSMVESIRQVGISAPVHVAVSTLCGPTVRWTSDNVIAKDLHRLIDEGVVHLGADTDRQIGLEGRVEDGCHLNLLGQRATAESFVSALRDYKSHDTR
jgi:hypothetical protein